MARLGGYFRGLGKGRGRRGSIRGYFRGLWGREEGGVARLGGTLEDCGVEKREAWLD